MDIEVKCNHCNNFYDVDEAHTGQEIECPDCGKKFIIQPHQRKETTPASYPAPQSEDGLLLGLYRLEGEVAEGGMGKVFKVHHTGWNVDLAMKQPHPEMFVTEAQKQTFSHECEAWINLGLHPHIVSCYYVREIDGVPNIFAEWMEGGDLSHWIESRQLYEGDEKDILERILDIAIQFAWGLDYAHENGLIHQDVKPENVMLTTEGDVKIADFGIANAKKDIGISSSIATQFSGTMISDSGAYTPAYCSPEQANGQKLTRRTDIWSWAVSVLEMFTIDRLWDVGSVAGIACDEYFEQTQVSIPDSIKKLLKECFKENESERPKDFKVITDQLLEIYKHISERNYERTFPKAASDSPDSLNNRALSYKDMGMPEKAEELWNKALKLDPHHLDTNFNKSLLMCRMGRLDWPEAHAAIKNVLPHQENPWMVNQAIGWINLECGNSEKGLAEFDLAKELGGDTQVPPQAGKILAKQLRTFEGHSFRVNTVAFSPCGKFAISGGDDDKIKLWDVDSGEGLRTFEGHKSGVKSVKFSPDGHSLLSGSWDGTLRLWDISTGQCIQEMCQLIGHVDSVAFSPDGCFALAGSDNSRMELWDLESGKSIQDFIGHSNKVTCVAFSPDGKLALSGSWDKLIKLWDVSSGRCLRDFEGHTYYLHTIAFSPDGKLIISAQDYGEKTILWETDSGHKLCTHDGFGIITSAEFSPDGQRIAGAGTSINFWETLSGFQRRTLEGHSSEPNVHAISVSPDSNFILFGNEDGSVKLWDLTCYASAGWRLSRPHSSKESIALQQHFDECVAEFNVAIHNYHIGKAIDWLEKARSVPGYHHNPFIAKMIKEVVPHCHSSQPRSVWLNRTIHAHSQIWSLCLSSNGHSVTSGTRDGMVRLWNLDSCKCKHAIKIHTDNEFVKPVAYGNDGNTALVCDQDGSHKVWNVQTGVLLTQKNLMFSNSVAICPSGPYAASSQNKKVMVWNWQSGEKLWSFEHDDVVHKLEFSPDGSSIVTSEGHPWFTKQGVSPLRLFDIKTGDCILTLSGDDGATCCLTFSFDGRYLLSGSNHFIKLWDTVNGECLKKIDNNGKSPTFIGFFPDNRFSATTDDYLLRIWDLAKGKCVYQVEAPEGDVHWQSLCCSCCGSFIVSGSSDGTIKQWFIDWEYETGDTRPDFLKGVQ